MIEAIRNIGEYALEKEGKVVDKPLEILVDDLETNPKNPSYKNILFILIHKENGAYKYCGVDLDQYSRKNLKLYLYKQGSSNGPDITPTARITRIKAEGGKKPTFETKILSWFKQQNKTEFDEKICLSKIYECLKENKEKIQMDLEAKYNSINKQEKATLTLKIDDKYIGEFKIFQDILIDKAKENYYSKYGKISKSDDHICSVCNERNAEVYGFVDTYKFYTVDKPGFVSGGFQQRDAWKNYPVCLNCALTLEAGKKYIGTALNFNFYGFKYILIPQFLNGTNKSIRTTLFKRIESQRDPKFGRDGNAISSLHKITNDEEEILELLSDEQKYLNLNFMFYDAPKGYQGSVFNIILYIEDIMPSRLKALFEAKVGNKENNMIGVDQISIFKNCMVPVFENNKKTGEKPMEFNFGVLRAFFPKVSNNRTYNKYFLDIVNNIFTKKSIDYGFLINFIMRKIRDEFVNGYQTNISTLKGFMLLNYLNKLKLMELNGGAEMADDQVNNFKIEKNRDLDIQINSFFNEFSDFFDSDEKNAVFLVGVLAQKLLNIQRLPEVRNAKPGKEPFRHNLRGLKLDDRQIKTLLPKIQNKLEEYGKNYYRPLETRISKYFVSAGNNWNMSNDEISYYFVLGMNLSYLFKKEEKNNEGDSNE